MNDRVKKWFLPAAIGVCLLIYLSSGFYSLESGQHALTLRFGRIVGIGVEPGICYHLPQPFETVKKVRVRQVQKVVVQSEKGEGIESFTGDENLILVKAVVSYDVKDAQDYLFNVAEAEALIKSAAESRLNREIAGLEVDEVMTTGKSVLRLVLKREIQRSLDELGLGVRVISLELTDIAPPQNVSQAFRAVSDAREKKQRIIKEAEGYANTIIPKSRGEAISILNQSEAFANETVNLARARAQAFTALNAEYLKDPEITAKMRYLETIRKIYAKCNVIIDSNPSRSIYYIGKDGKVKKGGEKEKNSKQ